MVAYKAGVAQAVQNSSGTEPPRNQAPLNAADCHIHIYDPRFAPQVGRVVDATVADYRLMQKRIGLARVVIVQPRNYKVDNSVTLDAKVSGAYMNSWIGPPEFPEATAIAKAYVEAIPQRLVWGSDWPHPSGPKVKPDDGSLFDLLAVWAPEEATRHAILVTTPEALYGFPKSS